MSKHKKVHEKNAKLGYSLYLVASACWALNGTVAKVILEEVGDPVRISQFRATFTALILIIFVALTNRKAFRMELLALLCANGFIMNPFLACR